MSSRKSVGPRKQHWGRPELTEYSCQDSHLEPLEEITITEKQLSKTKC